ncbi:phosphoglycerate mutase-like protein 4 isoform X2 [Amaranthus tricolor]|uniref:phosphoglycerate mutase-like protein 4 isoform X2 n=1 Tax=Amaranthus tricolor TaxID=29722 RepID=UPI0025856CAD|nr:phosphoglycerate mutase-like protein 4 isoform X2 [Amaranthus tricolor]
MASSPSRLSREYVENGTIRKETRPTKEYCTEIIIVRHGETDWNALHKMQVAERLAREPKISAIYSSDLKRALETAQTIASKCFGLEVVIDKDLRERHIGDLQGLVFSEASKINPIAFEALMSNSEHQQIPGGGESRNQLFERCTSSLQRIAKKNKGARVVVVTHGAVIEMLYKRAIRGGKAGGVWNTSISIFELSDGDKWCIKLWNDISHLKESEYLESASGGSAST